MRKLSLWILIGGVVIGAAACASGTSTSSAPPASNVTGRWVGTWTFDPSSAGNGEVIADLTQDGSQVKGTLQSVTGPHRGRAGFFNATMSGNDLHITGPDATGWLKVSGNQMTGTINGILPANLTLRKQ
jgi:ABC-type glycerol-3-phosphate transport system substrate-binding protein